MESQHRALVVTDKFLYKLDPSKSFRTKKPGLPINLIHSAVITEKYSQLTVLKIRDGDTDDVVYLNYKEHTHDRVAELLANIYRVILK